MTRTSSIPARQSSRLLKLGRLAGGLAAGMAAEGIRRLVAGERPTAGELLAHPRNAAQVAERLSELRGAAMKIGQLLSMEAGQLLPKELSLALARLRDDAHSMPLGEVAARLDQAWGKNWHTGFSRFNFTPMAAASIGQVHEAVTRDGRRLAVKIQYPGIRESIDSDVDNAARLLALLGAAPGDGELAPVLHEAKRQLHQEADYLGEARRLMAYADLLGDDTRFQVPEVDHQRTTQEVLVMSYVPGGPLETLERAGPAERHAIATRLMELSLREVFEWGLVQTDPNFSNYRYDEPNGVIGLLDFGAVRTYPCSRTSILRRLLCAGVNNDPPSIEQAAMEAGYLGAGDPAAYRKTVVSLLMDATEPARHSGKYDFASCGLPDRMREKVMELRFGQRLWRLPPLDLLLLHRKLGGLYMLCARLRARVPVQQLIQPYLA